MGTLFFCLQLLYCLKSKSQIVFGLFSNCSQSYTAGKDIAKTSRITIPWTHVPVASKLGLRPQTVSPRRHISSHGMTQSFPKFCSCLSLPHDLCAKKLYLNSLNPLLKTLAQCFTRQQLFCRQFAQQVTSLPRRKHGIGFQHLRRNSQAQFVHFC